MFVSKTMNTSKPEMLYVVLTVLNVAVLFALQAQAVTIPVPELLAGYSRELVLTLLAGTFVSALVACLQHADRKRYPWRAPRARITVLVVLALLLLDAAAWLRFQ